jgi:hypothetical protein
MTLLVDVPTDFKGVTSVSMVGGEVRIRETKIGREFEVPVKKFL